MRDSQIGLLIVPPLITAMAVLLTRRGALAASGAVAITLASFAIAAWLFLSH